MSKGTIKGGKKWADHVQYQDGVLFTTVHSINVTCQNAHRHQAPATRNVSLTADAVLAATLKHGKKAPTISVSSFGFIEIVVSKKHSRLALNEEE
jgi:hypothetical protein